MPDLHQILKFTAKIQLKGSSGESSRKFNYLALILYQPKTKIPLNGSVKRPEA